ncbi:MAG: universal stress protein [Vicingaceae bacterium]
MQRILIPVDFTGCSRAAIDYALDIYDPDIYSFVLLHAYGSDRTSEFLVSIDDIIDHDIDRKLAIEKERMQRKHNKKKVQVEFVREKCELLEAINKVVETKPISLLVIGSDKGISWNGSSDVGSLKTMTVIKEVSLPVLVVPQKGELRHPKDFLFATRLKNGMNEQALAPLVSVVKSCKGHLDVVNVESGHLGQDVAKQLLEETINGFFKGLAVDTYTVKGTEILESIKDFTQGHHSDLVCILYQDHSFLERLLKDSISEQMVKDLHWPLLALKHTI